MLDGLAGLIPAATVAEEPAVVSLACCALAPTPTTEALRQSAQKNLDFI
jgi:hypothetical protein